MARYPFRHQIMVVDPKWMDERVSKPEYRAAVLAGCAGSRAWLARHGTEPFIEKAVAEVQASWTRYRFLGAVRKVRWHTRARIGISPLPWNCDKSSTSGIRQESVKFRNCTANLFSTIHPLRLYA